VEWVLIIWLYNHPITVEFVSLEECERGAQVIYKFYYTDHDTTPNTDIKHVDSHLCMHRSAPW